MSLQLKTEIEKYFGMNEVPAESERVISEVIHLLDLGRIRVAEKIEGKWVTHEWVKKAILLYFRTQKMEVIEAGPFRFHDKIPLKSWSGQEGVRVVPHALVRRGAFVASGAILMPSYVNIGAHVGSGTMVDTWATDRKSVV